MSNKIKAVKQSLLMSQSCLFGFLIICSLLKPHVMVVNGGVSNFGKYKFTVVLYVLGFLLDIIFLLKATQQIRQFNEQYRNLVWFIGILAGLTFLVLISTFPRYLSPVYSTIHDDFGIALYGYEFLLSIWLVSKIKTRLSSLALTIEIIGSLLALLSILKVIHFLYIGQFIGAAGFAVLLVFIFPKLFDLVSNSKTVF
jgi:hypothetical protein